MSHEKPTVSEIKSILALAEKIRFLEREKREIYDREFNYSSYEDFEREAGKKTEEDLEAYRVKYKAFFAEYELSPDEMRLVLEYKKSKAGAERQLNCRVFEDIRNEACSNYLKQLVENSESLVGQRFQMIMQNLDARPQHWSTADIFIDRDCMYLLHFDTLKANYEGRGRYQKGGLNGNVLEEILKSIQSTKPISLVDAYMQMDGKLVDLQHELRSCSLFATATALDMSKVSNLHELAKGHAVRLEDSPVKNNVTRYSIDALYLPASFVRNAQSRALIDYYEKHQPAALKIIPRKSGPKKLKKYVDSRSHKTSDAEKLQNFGILHTRAHYKKIVKEQSETKTESSAKGIKKDKP